MLAPRFYEAILSNYQIELFKAKQLNLGLEDSALEAKVLLS